MSAARVGAFPALTRLAACDSRRFEAALAGARNGGEGASFTPALPVDNGATLATLEPQPSITHDDTHTAHLNIS